MFKLHSHSFPLYKFIWTVFFVLLRRLHPLNLSKQFRNTLYIKNPWERGDKNFILIKLGGAKIRTAMLRDYRAWQKFPLKYDCFRHTQQILKYILKKGPHDWNNRTVDININGVAGRRRRLESECLWVKFMLLSFCDAADKLRTRVTVEVHRSHTQLDAHKLRARVTVCWGS